MIKLGKDPYKFGVFLDLFFWLTPGGNKPDLSNLVKAFEDSLQGAVIVNDTQVIEIHAIRKFRPENCVIADIYAWHEP